jgi:hypothetical protein
VWSAARSGLFTLGKATRYKCTGGEVGLQAVLVGSGKIRLREGYNLGLSSP